MSDTDQMRPRGGRLPRKARRAQLLDSALEVFVAQGYHAAAMDDIAERAGVSKPVLYQHFPGKLELYLALLEQSSDRIIDATHEALASTHDNKLRVHRDDAGVLRLRRQRPGRVPAGLRVRPHQRAAGARAGRPGHSVCAEEIAKVIHEDTGLPDEASRLLAVSLVGMAQVSARFWLDEGGEIDQADAATLVAGLAWRGISRFPLHRRAGLTHAARADRRSSSVETRPPSRSVETRPPAANGLG